MLSELPEDCKKVVLQRIYDSEYTTDSIKTKIENNEAITTEDFDDVFETNVSPN